jgi:hypothetical protein
MESKDGGVEGVDVNVQSIYSLLPWFGEWGRL